MMRVIVNILYGHLLYLIPAALFGIVALGHWVLFTWVSSDGWSWFFSCTYAPALLLYLWAMHDVGRSLRGDEVSANVVSSVAKPVSPMRTNDSQPWHG